MAVLLIPVCAEMRGYDSDSSNLSCSTRRINSGLSASTAFVHSLKCPFTAGKMDISIGTGKGRRRYGLNETVTFFFVFH